MRMSKLRCLDEDDWESLFGSLVTVLAVPDTESVMACLPDLPPELRNTIYRHVLDAEQSANQTDLVRRVQGRAVRPQDRLQPRNPTLMCVNSFIREELGSMFFGERTMRLSTCLYEVPVVISCLHRVWNDVGREAPFRTLTIHIMDVRWEDMGEIMPLLQFIRTSDFRAGSNKFYLRARGVAGIAARLLSNALQAALMMAVMSRRVR